MDRGGGGDYGGVDWNPSEIARKLPVFNWFKGDRVSDWSGIARELLGNFSSHWK